jgi:hypothetical protein
MPRAIERYKTIHTPCGTVILDRRLKTWTVVKGTRILDYGRMSSPGWTAYLNLRNR